MSSNHRLDTDNSAHADELKLTIGEFHQICDDRLPFASLLGLELEALEPRAAIMRANFKPEFLRPGGTVAGPVMMGLADAVIYAVILSRIGPVELAVTTNLSINFLRRPLPADLVARATLLKLGKRLAVAECHLYSCDDELHQRPVASVDLVGLEPVAHVTATYSIPPLIAANTEVES